MPEPVDHSRPVERAELRRLFEQGASAQMSAPRRLGKTWLMRATAKDLADAGWTTIVIDVEGVQTEADFLKALCQQIEKVFDVKQRIWAHLGQRLNQLLGGKWEDSPIKALGSVDPKDFADALVAALDAQDRDTVIFVDEIALFVAERLKADPAGVGGFLYHLRKLRQAYPKVRWLFTGSIGLDVVARRVNLQGALVDLEVFALEPFSPGEARSFLAELAAKSQVRTPCELDDATFDYLAAELGWLSPYYLKLVIDRLRPTGEACPGGLRLAGRDDVDRAFEALLAPNHRVSFATWEEHIEKNFPPTESGQLRDILAVCCEAADGEIVATVLARVTPTHPALTPRELMDRLTALSVAGFVHEADGRWRFTSGLLRRYWLKYRHA